MKIGFGAYWELMRWHGCLPVEFKPSNHRGTTSRLPAFTTPRLSCLVPPPRLQFADRKGIGRRLQKELLFLWWVSSGKIDPWRRFGCIQ
jgi:hypothetical protein